MKYALQFGVGLFEAGENEKLSKHRYRIWEAFLIGGLEYKKVLRVENVIMLDERSRWINIWDQHSCAPFAVSGFIKGKTDGSIYKEKRGAP